MTVRKALIYACVLVIRITAHVLVATRKSAFILSFGSSFFVNPIIPFDLVHMDLLANPKCSLFVTRDPEDRTDLVITLHGDAISVSEKDKAVVRTAYLAKHPNAFWVEFGDFQFMRIEPKVVRFVSGAALLGSGDKALSDAFCTALSPISFVVFSNSYGIVDCAYMLDLDSLGFNVKAGYQRDTFKLCIPFPRRAENRK
ncbi:hypothetical protein REPUB_Repub16aG0091300 [Reevesia pubescens]